jgi:hypothetical protein
MFTISFIRAHINRLKDDAIFTTRDLLSYGTRPAVDTAIHRLIKKDLIIRLCRGVFMKCSGKAVFGQQLPSAFAVANAKARGFGKEIFIHKKDAAARFGLIKTGNDNPTFATYGRTTSFKYREKTIKLTHVSPKDAKLGDTFAGLVIRAIKQIGNHEELPTTLLNMRRTANKAEITELQRSTALMPSWLSKHLLDNRIAAQLVHTLTTAGNRKPAFA